MNITAAAPLLPRIGAPVSEDVARRAVRRLEGVLLRAAAGPDLIARASHHLLSAGGKRLRPRLVMLSAMASVPRRRGVLHLALAADAVHSATLLHDDVIDGARIRRGRASVPAAYGNAAAVLAGDEGFATAIELVLRSGVPRALPELVGAIRAIVRAEARQLGQRSSPGPDGTTSREIHLGRSADPVR